MQKQKTIPVTKKAVIIAMILAVITGGLCGVIFHMIYVKLDSQENVEYCAKKWSCPFFLDENVVVETKVQENACFKMTKKELDEALNQGCKIETFDATRQKMVYWEVLE